MIIKTPYQEQSIVNLIEDPQVFYTIQNKYDPITSVLGGSSVLGQVIHNDLDLISITRKRLPKSAIQTISKVVSATQDFGSNWIRENNNLALKIPSAVLPFENNVLVNPNHKLILKMKISKILELNLDTRL